MVTPEERQQVAALVLATLRSLGRDDLIPMLTIQWKPFASRIGDALYDPGEGLCRLRFSDALWSRAHSADRVDTVIHEVAHLVCWHEETVIAGRPSPEPHGAEWRAVMRRTGFEPKRCHAIDPTGLPGRKRRIPAHCTCSGVTEVTSILANRIRKGVRYTCTECGQIIVLDQ